MRNIVWIILKGWEEPRDRALGTIILRVKNILSLKEEKDEHIKKHDLSHPDGAVLDTEQGGQGDIL